MSYIKIIFLIIKHIFNHCPTDQSWTLTLFVWDDKKGAIFTKTNIAKKSNHYFNINAQPDFQILKGLYGSFIEVVRDYILTGFFVCVSM